MRRDYRVVQNRGANIAREIEAFDNSRFVLAT